MQYKLLEMVLLQNQHLAQERPIVCPQLIEIDTTRNAFTEIVATIPIRRMATACVVAFRLMSETLSDEQRCHAYHRW